MPVEFVWIHYNTLHIQRRIFSSPKITKTSVKVFTDENNFVGQTSATIRQQNIFPTKKNSVGQKQFLPTIYMPLADAFFRRQKIKENKINLKKFHRRFICVGKIKKENKKN